MNFFRERFIKPFITLILFIAVELSAANFFDVVSPYPNNTISDKSDDFFRVIDVGQGDSFLLCSNGKAMLIDTGAVGNAQLLCAKLNKYGVRKIDIMLITHFHADHVGGASEILRYFDIETLVMPQITEEYKDFKKYFRLEEGVIAHSGKVLKLDCNDKFKVGDFSVSVIYYSPEKSDINNRSAVLQVDIGNKKILLMGDAEKEAEAEIIEKNENISCDILKIGHHGSHTSGTKEFLSACDAEYTVISCGRNNEFSHPHDSTLKRIEKSDTVLYRTDVNRDITFYFCYNEIYPEVKTVCK